MPKCTFSLLVAIVVLAGCTGTTGSVSRLAEATALFPLTGLGQQSLLVYKDSDATLSLYEVRDGGFIERASIDSPAVPHRAVVLGDRIIVAYGYGRGTLSDPIRIVRYDTSLNNPTELFMRQSGRSEISELIAVPERDELFVSFFTSTYVTSAGWLHPDDGSYEEIIGTRLGMRYDIAGDLIVQGRPYGDALGVDGDVTLFAGTGSQRLPSFRGVSEIRFAELDDDPDLEILIADGWHQNYAQIAEPRVSVLDKKNGVYVLETLAVLRPQHSISTIHPFTVGEKRYVFLVGNSHADILDLSDRSVRNVYSSTDLWFDAVFIGKRDSTIDLVIKEGGDAWLMSVDL